jgi:ATP-dependent RNA helicase HelY
MTTTALEVFEHSLKYPLDPFQRAAGELLEAGSSVLVAAPTGSGKTTVAEFAVNLARRERDTHVFYTTPIKALSNQKYAELCREYGEDQVGLLTGDVNRNGDAPIVVMTTEVLRNMIYEQSQRLALLSFVVLDEVHYLGDRHRGAVWEEIILHLPRHVRLVALSATVSNSEELGDWMHAVRGDTEVIISERRPVPLYQHVLTTKAMLPLLVNKRGALASHGRLNSELRRLPGAQPRKRSRGSAPRRNRPGRVSRSDIARALDETDLLPAITFIFSRVGCDEAVKQCLYDGVSLTTSAQRREIRKIANSALSTLSEQDKKVLGTRRWLQGLERGIGAHHAGLLPAFKRVVEELFQKRLLKLVFATETLALGINMPARAVVVEKLEKFNGEERVPLTSGEYTQLTGRAGRRGIDDEGHAVVVWGEHIDLDMLANLAGNRSFPVVSSFVPTFNMAVNMLERTTPSHARETLERSFAQFQADRSVVALAEDTRKLESSLSGYEEAADRANDEETELRWRSRAKKMRKRVRRMRKRIQFESGGLVRVFDRVVEILGEFGYLEGSNDEINPTRWGALLQRIYGDRDLLTTECIRRGYWDDLDAPTLAAIVCALTYEPRRSEGAFYGEVPSPSFAPAFDSTVRLWSELDRQLEHKGLTRSQMPELGMSPAMFFWARNADLSEVLRVAGTGAGEFVRWARQTIDLLGQIHAATGHVADDLEVFDQGEADRLKKIGRSARRAADALRHGIVEVSEP